MALSWPSGADDGIRTRDPHLGKVMESVHPVLLRPSTWAPSVLSSGKCCQIRPVVTRVTTGRSAPRARRVAAVERQNEADGRELGPGQKQVAVAIASIVIAVRGH